MAANSNWAIFNKYHFSISFRQKRKFIQDEFKMVYTAWFSVAFFSTLIGALGPVLNPFYLNYGLQKERMIATKTINSFFIGLVQVSSYAALGSLHDNLWMYGIVLGAGASAGNWIGKKFLKRFSDKVFRIFVIAVMVISGVLLIAKQFQRLC